MRCIFAISRLRTAKRAKIESLLLSDGSALSLNNIEDFLFLARYANRYSNAHDNNITKSIWSEIMWGIPQTDQEIFLGLGILHGTFITERRIIYVGFR